MTGAVDALDVDSALPAGVTRPWTSTQLDGFDAGHPNTQLRIAVSFCSWVEGQRATFGLWGYLAGLETDTKLNGDNAYTAWAGGADWTIPLFGPLSIRGEAWIGQALADVRGGIGQ